MQHLKRNVLESANFALRSTTLTFDSESYLQKRLQQWVQFLSHLRQAIHSII